MLYRAIDLEKAIVYVEPEGMVKENEWQDLIRLISPMLQQRAPWSWVFHSPSYSNWAQLMTLTCKKNHSFGSLDLIVWVGADFPESFKAELNSNMAVFDYEQLDLAKKWVIDNSPKL